MTRILVGACLCLYGHTRVCVHCGKLAARGKLRRPFSSIFLRVRAGTDDRCAHTHTHTRQCCTHLPLLYFPYTFTRYPLHTHEHEQIELSLPVLSSTGNCICIYLPTYLPTSLRLARRYNIISKQLEWNDDVVMISCRRWKFVSSATVPPRACMQTRRGRLHGGLHFFIANRKTIL